MVDKPKAGTEGNKPQIEKPSAPPISATGESKSPTPTGQAKGENTSNRRKYANYVVGPVVAIYRFLRGGFLLADQHNSGITALATVAIVILTIFYVKYSKKQWQTIHQQLSDNRAMQAAQVTIEVSPPTVKEGVVQGMLLVEGNVIVRNVGQTAAVNLIVFTTMGFGKDRPTGFSGATAGVHAGGATIGTNESEEFPFGGTIGNKDQLLSGEYFGSLDVWVAWEDVFKTPNEAKLCLLYDPKTQKFGYCH